MLSSIFVKNVADNHGCHLGSLVDGNMTLIVHVAISYTLAGHPRDRCGCPSSQRSSDADGRRDGKRKY